MKITRREFVGGAASCVAGLSLLKGTQSVFAGARSAADCSIVDLGTACALRESLLGYEAALKERARVLDMARPRFLEARLVIVPGAGSIDEELTSTIVDSLEYGATVVLESGAAFLEAAKFADQQAMLRSVFGISAEEPISLWSGSGRVPYIHYSWPIEMQMRDFSRAVPVGAERGEASGRVGGLRVALKKRASNGQLVFLGSPLGPGLRAGDEQAYVWLMALLTNTI